MRTPTTDQLRHDIDSGATGEKVAMPDPAAAPLGTDAEAAGAPPTVAERALAASQAPASPDSGTPPNGIAVYLLLLFAVTAGLVAVMFLAQS